MNIPPNELIFLGQKISSMTCLILRASVLVIILYEVLGRVIGYHLSIVSPSLPLGISLIEP